MDAPLAGLSTAVDESFHDRIEIGMRLQQVLLLDKWHKVGDIGFFGTRGDRSLSIYIPDKDVGSDHYSALVKLDDWEFTASHDDPGPIAVTMRLLPNREVTWTTAST